ncbi:glycosyltransferase involved in cell wall biosynthesis [Salinibacter ruber]|jgi:glycosyltransferase involved in cell wall biosynthesis|uniref:glycosyltransferase family 2 protein n=1 Tax=Salinibacter ruber TaxID=146919 RepID=UPI00216A1FA4|nr:glycosyltransferase family 2 protein [Salinibacter ruber]MCS3753178.1 glycosyltransferase involved in cell wall biosynthesis [Salinibacter ruber]
MSSKAISICILTYNRKNKLEKTIESVLRQKYTPDEIVINDDYSKDGTRKIGKKYEREYDIIRYERNSTNVGYAENNNKAIKRARGQYVGIVHDGDILKNNLVGEWVSKLERYDSVALVFQGYYGRGCPEGCTHGYPSRVDGERLVSEILSRWDCPIFGVVALRKKFVSNTGRFDSSYPWRADVDMWARLLNKYDAAYIDKPMIKYDEREEDHDLRGINWEAETNLIEMRKKNILELIGDKQTRQKLLKEFKKEKFVRIAKNIAICIKNGELEKALEGTKKLYYFLGE